MDRIGLLAFTVICLSVWSGCNKASDPAVDQSNASEAIQSPVKSDLGSSTPAEAVITFLNALRAGDEVKTAQMLTVMAREEMARRNLFPEPPGSDTAKFSIGETIFEPGDQDVAHVESRWNDNSEVSLVEGPDDTVWEITWVLRREDSGWRIAGMATRPFVDEPPLILNFEDPDDMQQKVERVDKELARRSEFPQTQNR